MKKIRGKQTQISEILQPTNGYRGQLAKKGITPKDHQKDNLKHIQEKHKAFIEKKATIEESKKESYS